MGLFEYIMVLTSILIGLGIAELLNGIVRMLRSDFREGVFLPQLLWSVYLMLYLILVWWSRWDLHDHFEWNFFQLMMSLIGPILIFVLAGLVFARNESARDYYFRIRPVFFTLLPLAVLAGVCHETIIEGTPVISVSIALGTFMVILALIPRFTTKFWIHVLCPAFATSIFLVWLFPTTFLIHD